MFLSMWYIICISLPYLIARILVRSFRKGSGWLDLFIALLALPLGSLGSFVYLNISNYFEQKISPVKFLEYENNLENITLILILGPITLMVGACMYKLSAYTIKRLYLFVREFGAIKTLFSIITWLAVIFITTGILQLTRHIDLYWGTYVYLLVATIPLIKEVKMLLLQKSDILSQKKGWLILLGINCAVIGSWFNSGIEDFCAPKQLSSLFWEGMLSTTLLIIVVMMFFDVISKKIYSFTRRKLKCIDITNTLIIVTTVFVWILTFKYMPRYVFWTQAALPFWAGIVASDLYKKDSSYDTKLMRLGYIIKILMFVSFMMILYREWPHLMIWLTEHVHGPIMANLFSVIIVGGHSISAALISLFSIMALWKDEA